jgi:hypothetical protein
MKVALCTYTGFDEPAKAVTIDQAHLARKKPHSSFFAAFF